MTPSLTSEILLKSWFCLFRFFICAHRFRRLLCLSPLPPFCIVSLPLRICILSTIIENTRPLHFSFVFLPRSPCSLSGGVLELAAAALDINRHEAAVLVCAHFFAANSLRCLSYCRFSLFPSRAPKGKDSTKLSLWQPDTMARYPTNHSGSKVAPFPWRIINQRAFPSIFSHTMRNISFILVATNVA